MPNPPIDWAALEERLRTAFEAVRATPRHAPAAIEDAVTAVAEVAGRAGGGPLARGFAEILAACRAAGTERLGHAARHLSFARDLLEALRRSH